MDPDFVHARIQSIGPASRDLRIRLKGSGISEVQQHRLEGDTLLLSLPKYDLPYGINTIALLNAGTVPVAERSFFNEAGWTPATPELEVETRMDSSGDSLYLRLAIPETGAEKYSVSLSALPAESRAYRPQHSLFSAFYLRPYVDIPFSGHGIENLTRRKDRHAHDLRLRSRDDKDPTRESASDLSEYIFPMEGDLKFSGRAPFADLQYEKQLWTLTDTNQEYQIINLETDKTFSGSGRLYLGDTLKISLLSRKGILKKELVELDFEAPTGWALPIPSSQVAEAPEPLGDLQLQETEEIEDLFFQEDRDVIALDEVEVTERRENKEIQTRSALIVGKRVVGSDIQQTPSLMTYLRKQGFKPRYEGGRLVILSKTPARGAQAGYIPVPVFLNGMLSDGTNLDIPLSNVESVFYDTYGLEFISVNMRLQNYHIANRERYSDFFIPIGYSFPKKYKVPFLKDSAGELFRQYGQVYWVPELKVVSGTPSEIAIPLVGQDDLLIHLEGMGSDGSILQQTIRFQPSN